MNGCGGISRSIAIKTRLAVAGLSSQWLILRLQADHNIVIDKSRLSQILGGAYPNGKVTEQVLSCSEKVLDNYEAHYGAQEV